MQAFSRKCLGVKTAALSFRSFDTAPTAEYKAATANVHEVCGTDKDTAPAFVMRYGTTEAAVSAFYDTGGVLPDE